MSLALLVYLGGVFVVIAYSAYIDADDPLPLVFLALIWPVALSFVVPVAVGYALRAVVDQIRKAK